MVPVAIAVLALFAVVLLCPVGGVLPIMGLLAARFPLWVILACALGCLNFLRFSFISSNTKSIYRRRTW